MEERSSFNIPIAKPSFGGGELDLIKKSLETGWVSQGPLVKQFEEEVCAYVKCDQAVAVTSCTTGLHLATLILDIGPGDEVICPSFSFIATANSMVHGGASVQFCDVDESTFNLDPVHVRQFIEESYNKNLINHQSGKKLKAVLVVHQIGLPADIDSFNSIGKDYGITIIEDSACAIGSFYKGEPLGSSGNIGVLSFHPRKVITCGEGGMLLLKDETLAEKARVLREHGASISVTVRHQAKSNVYEQYEHVGYNYRMTDLQAALGIKQLEELESIVKRRIAIAERYNEAFGDSSGSVLSIVRPKEYMTRWNYQSYPLILKEGLESKRDMIMEDLYNLGIATRRGIPPIHKEPAYAEHSDKKLSITESLSKRVFFLPIFPAMTDGEVEHVISSVLACKQKHLETKALSH